MAQTTSKNALRRERELRGWSQRYVAEQIEAPSQNYISRWERGEITPSPYYRERLCRLFEKNAQELGLVQVQEETTNEGSHSNPELIPNVGPLPPIERERTKGAPDRKYRSWLTRHRWAFLGALLLIPFVISSFVIYWQYTSTTRTWPQLQYNIHVESQEVMTMQYMLKARSYDIGLTGVDGVYGPATDNAVRAFQEAYHLPQNNGVDSPTWEQLIMPSEEGSIGSQVQALQAQLNAHHIKPPLAVDGIFGPATEKAVRQFQQTNHLPVTGKADLDVWCLLVGGHISKNTL